MMSAPFAVAHRRSLSEILVLDPIRLLATSRPWAAALFGVLSFAIGTFWFVTLVALIATGVGLAITFLGIPLLLGTAWLWTWGARVERARVNAFFGTHIRSSYREIPAGSWFARIRAFITDPAIWRDLAYLFVLFPVGIAELVVVVTAITMPLRLITMPFWWDASSLPGALFFVLLAVPLLLLMPYLLIGMGALHVALARRLLSTAREEELAQRVGELTESRSRAVDIALAERRRIERDLHDGAQQRLVALAMDLGMAKIKMESDPEAARRLVDAAHQEAKQTLVDIRNLVRGIHPAVLTDRGLDAAVSALAGRSTIPVAVTVELDERLPDRVESTAYFVVAEALTNAAKHSVATEAHIDIRRRGDTLIVEVADNGVGGADPATGTGLAGLADRVAALDGRLSVASPRGGPTRIRAELPCGW